AHGKGGVTPLRRGRGAARGIAGGPHSASPSIAVEGPARNRGDPSEPGRASGGTPRERHARLERPRTTWRRTLPPRSHWGRETRWLSIRPDLLSPDFLYPALGRGVVAHVEREVIVVGERLAVGDERLAVDVRFVVPVLGLADQRDLDLVDEGRADRA